MNTYEIQHSNGVEFVKAKSKRQAKDTFEVLTGIQVQSIKVVK